MVSSRTATAANGLIASPGVSLAAWWLFDTLLVFLLVPLVPLPFRGTADGASPPVKRCPVRGFETRKPSVSQCPRDGTRLE